MLADQQIKIKPFSGEFLRKYRWVKMPLPTAEARKKGIRTHECLVWGAVWYRNRRNKRQIPTQRGIAALTGLRETHVSRYISRLRRVGLLDPDEIRIVEPDWDWCRRRQNGRPQYLRMPSP